MYKKSRVHSKAQKKAEAVVEVFVDGDSLQTDPLGSYTGKPRGRAEHPVQDADDL